VGNVALSVAASCWRTRCCAEDGGPIGIKAMMKTLHEFVAGDVSINTILLIVIILGLIRGKHFDIHIWQNGKDKKDER
jgi:hypothetical protein